MKRSYKVVPVSIFILIITIFSATKCLVAQTLVPVLQWERFVDGQIGYNGMDAALCISTDNSGNAYVSGYTRGDLTGLDFLNIKYNPQGDTLWTRKFIADNFDNLPISHCLDDNGNLYVLGYSLPVPGVGYYLLLKYSSSGQLLWHTKFNKLQPGNNNVPVNSLAVDSSGNSYFTAKTFASNADLAVIKVSPAGDSLWSRYYNGTGNATENATSLVLSDSGNIYVTGMSWNGTSYDYCTLKFDSAGNQKWVSNFDGTVNGTDYAYSIDVDNSGNVYVAGESYNGPTSTCFATVKYNSQGVQQWVRYYTSDSLSDKAQVVKIRNTNEIYVAGSSYGGHYTMGGTHTDLCVVKYNSSGQQQWVGRYTSPGAGEDYLNDMTFDNNNNVILAGLTNSDIFWKNIAVCCFSPSGNQLWSIDYDRDSLSQTAWSVAVDALGSLIIAGESNNDFCTLKYNFVTGINSSDQKNSVRLFPNPCNNELGISLTGVGNAVRNIEIYNIAGMLCRNISMNCLTSSGNEFMIDVHDLVSGTYFVVVNTSIRAFHAKLMIIR